MGDGMETDALSKQNRKRRFYNYVPHFIDMTAYIILR